MCTLKNPKEFTEKLTELISDFGLGTEYKVNEIHTHTHTHTHTVNKQLESKIFEIPFTAASKKKRKYWD